MGSESWGRTTSAANTSTSVRRRAALRTPSRSGWITARAGPPSSTSCRIVPVTITSFKLLVDGSGGWLYTGEFEFERERFRRGESMVVVVVGQDHSGCALHIGQLGGICALPTAGGSRHNPVA